ncbi:MAG: hypothetical protein M3P06_05785 [Acidobacteriota bacterium]|nr:hypothetical protein [Acidobacteriota bacterium]
MQKVMLGLALVAIVLPSFAQSPKKPWQLTVEERIALRTNPELARERVRASRQKESGGRPISSEASPPADDFDGQTHPELFLPTEVFRSLTTLAFLGPARSGQSLRRGLMPEVERLKLPAGFWERLRAVSTIHIADSLGERDLIESLHKEGVSGRRRLRQSLDLKQLDVCRSRAKALADARREFGQELFDRFLYEVIAVHKFRSETSLPDPELLMRSERGCP